MAKKHNTIVEVQLCYTKLNLMVEDINKWNISELRDADKAEILGLRDAIAKELGSIRCLSTVQLMKLKYKDVKQLKHETNALIKEWKELRGIYAHLCKNEDDKLFRTLGIKPTTDWNKIKQAYREKAKETHPDRNGGNDKKFIKVQEAYDKLKMRYGGN